MHVTTRLGEIDRWVVYPRKTDRKLRRVQATRTDGTGVVGAELRVLGLNPGQDSTYKETSW